MVTQPQLNEIIYPESDGKPMADNTKQFRWIVVIEQNLEWLFADDPNVFVAGDLLWYPVEGNNRLCTAPDAMVVFGRPKGDRGSYLQWKEENLPPQVVFEILSPGNTPREMGRKLVFYNTYGVEEYYIYDPDRNQLEGWYRSEDGLLDQIESIDGWISPRLGIRLQPGEELQLYRPDGVPFFSFAQINQMLDQERQRTEQERQRAEEERRRAEESEQRAAEMERLLQQYRDAFGTLESDRFGELDP
ncbi:Uma2 family endonuclease [Leptolyngbya sp. AN10]|uniref:Uma2 family endonuclease n=1 Tax=Leptolyngbya sp. AN10 TaxID=3423365 RepID=UPI003D320B58